MPLLLFREPRTLLINIAKQFSLSNNAKIVLSGGVQRNDVFFNVVGQGEPVLCIQQMNTCLFSVPTKEKPQLIKRNRTL